MDLEFGLFIKTCKTYVIDGHDNFFIQIDLFRRVHAVFPHPHFAAGKRVQDPLHNVCAHAEGLPELFESKSQCIIKPHQADGLQCRHLQVEPTLPEKSSDLKEVRNSESKITGKLIRCIQTQPLLVRGDAPILASCGWSSSNNVVERASCTSPFEEACLHPLFGNLASSLWSTPAFVEDKLEMAAPKSLH